MSVFFKPSDIKTIECSVHNLSRGGSAFAASENDEQVFIPPKIVDSVGIEVGDFLTAYCIDNHRAENGGEERFAVRWRAIRVTVKEKFTPTPQARPEAPPAAPAQVPVEDLVLGLLLEDRAWTTAQMAEQLKIEQLRVAHVLQMMHDKGEVARCEMWAKAGQERVSKLYYARDIDLLVDLIDEVVLDD